MLTQHHRLSASTNLNSHRGSVHTVSWRCPRQQPALRARAKYEFKVGLYGQRSPPPILARKRGALRVVAHPESESLLSVLRSTRPSSHHAPRDNHVASGPMRESKCVAVAVSWRQARALSDAQPVTRAQLGWSSGSSSARSTASAKTAYCRTLQPTARTERMCSSTRWVTGLRVGVGLA